MPHPAPRDVSIDLLIFLHGVDSSGAQMADLAAAWAEQTGLRVASPDASERSDQSIYGFQWFSLQGISTETWSHRVDAAAEAFDEVVDREIARAATSAERTVLVGFSQGTIMALDALGRGRCFAGVLGFSGRLAREPQVALRGGPILLVHGEADRRVPVEDAVSTRRALKAAGASARLTIVPGQGHLTSRAGEEAGFEFIAMLASRAT